MSAPASDQTDLEVFIPAPAGIQAKVPLLLRRVTPCKTVRATIRLPRVHATSFEEAIVPKYVIERDIPGAGKLTPAELNGISQRSCSVLHGMGPQIQWLHSYVTDDKIYCVYIAPDEASVREHAAKGGFPANSVAQVRTVIDPTTAEA
ncbi:DUF4242 domain-containing protein [Pseudoxanthomonas winnipegensis]|uniref:DUF4242 domain-containing protein n=1 Tax=Pseudoxanthomonas winnipegensis TaxID=2480810 RepID=UPI003F845BA1